MNPSTDQHSQRLLRAAGVYCTRPRRAILGILLAADRPLTPEAIARRLACPCDRTTVYRTLTCLVETGLAQKVYLNDRTAHYEATERSGRSVDHPHFTCSACGRTHCLPDLPHSPIPPQYQGFTIVKQSIRLEGLCPACQGPRG